jgi:2-polyprenyl-6-methoxyphenol hydroxylase-like FAD-dependent oxidoreductase
VGRWKLQAQIASQMYKDNIFLAGDTAHTYTPAGGFGMNAGFQDINQLAHTLNLLAKNPKANQFNIK